MSAVKEIVRDSLLKYLSRIQIITRRNQEDVEIATLINLFKTEHHGILRSDGVAIYVMSMTLTQQKEGSCKTNFRIYNSVTTPGCMHWNNERLLAFVNSDLKYHRHVVEVGLVYWYHINSDPRIPLIHHHSEKNGVVV